MSLGKILFEHDILGYGTHESIPVKLIKDGKPESYPLVSVLMDVKEDNTVLYQEAITNIQKQKELNIKYIAERMKNLPEGVTPADMREVMTEVGFVLGKYQGWTLRNLGTTELSDIIGPVTKKLFNEFPTGHFRQQYAVAHTGWNIKYHLDHKDFTVHGFRCMIPLKEPVHIVFRKNEENLLFKLTPGRAYFVNIASLHRAFHFEEEDRINLTFQMDRDDLIINGLELDPIGWESIPELYREFNEFSEFLSTKD